MSRADDHDQQRYLQQCIDTMWGTHALRDMLSDGFERLVGRTRRHELRFPKLRPLPVKAPPDPPLATLFESTVTITLPDDRRVVREPTLDEIKALRGKLDEWHNGLLDELLGGPIHNGVARPPSIADPNYNAMLTLQDMQNAWNTLTQPDPSMSGAGFTINAMDPYGAPRPVPMRRQPWPAGMQIGPQPMPQGVRPSTAVYESIMAECRGRGCFEIREEFDIARLLTVYTHIGPHYERSTVAVPDRVCATGSADHVRAFLRKWLRSIHDNVPMPDVPEVLEQRRNLCYLCGQERDPDVEPVVLDAKALHPELAKLGNGHAIDGATVEACSRECATAYAIKLEPVRSQPALGRFFEQRHQERHATLGDEVTDSESGRKRNPWRDDPDADAQDEIVVTTQEYGVWTISDDPSDDAA